MRSGITEADLIAFQLILNPIRDWNLSQLHMSVQEIKVPINLKPY